MSLFHTYRLRMAAKDQQSWQQLIRFLLPLTERVEFQPRTAYYNTGERLQWTPAEELQKDLVEQVIVPSPSSNMRRFFWNFQVTPQVLDLLVSQVSPLTSDQWDCLPIPKLYRHGVVLMEWDHDSFWLKLTEQEAKTLQTTGLPVIGPHTQRRQYQVELNDLEQDWLKLLDFLVPKANYVTFQAHPVTVRSLDQQGIWQEKLWQWFPSNELGLSGDCSVDGACNTWSFLLTSSVETFLRSHDCLGEWHLGNELPENPCLLAEEELILTTISHEELVFVRLLETELPIFKTLEIGTLTPYPDHANATCIKNVA